MAGDSLQMNSDLRRRSRWPLRLLEEALRRLGAGRLLLPARLLWPSSLPLARAGALTPAGFSLRACSLHPVARRQTDLQLDDLVPYGIGPLMVWYRQKLPQSAARIRQRRLIAHGLGSRLLVGCGRRFDRSLFDGLFFVHLHIIARIRRSNPMLPFTSGAVLVLSKGRLSALTPAASAAARKSAIPANRGRPQNRAAGRCPVRQETARRE